MQIAPLAQFGGQGGFLLYDCFGTDDDRASQRAGRDMTRRRRRNGFTLELRQPRRRDRKQSRIRRKVHQAPFPTHSNGSDGINDLNRRMDTWQAAR